MKFDVPRKVLSALGVAYKSDYLYTKPGPKQGTSVSWVRGTVPVFMDIASAPLHFKGMPGHGVIVATDREECVLHSGPSWYHGGHVLCNQEGFVLAWSPNRPPRGDINVCWGADTEGVNLQPTRPDGSLVGISEVAPLFGLYKLKWQSKMQCLSLLASQLALEHAPADFFYYCFVDIVVPILLQLSANHGAPLKEIDGGVLHALDIQFTWEICSKRVAVPRAIGSDAVRMIRASEACLAARKVIYETYQLVGQMCEVRHVVEPLTTWDCREEWDPVEAFARDFDAPAGIARVHCPIAPEFLLRGPDGKVRKPLRVGAAGGRLGNARIWGLRPMQLEDAVPFTEKMWSLEDFDWIKANGSSRGVAMGHRGGHLSVAMCMPDGGCWWWALNCFVRMENSGIQLSHDTWDHELEALCARFQVPLSRGSSPPDRGIWLVPAPRDVGEEELLHAVVIKPVDHSRVLAKGPTPPVVAVKKTSEPSSIWAWRRKMQTVVRRCISQGSYTAWSGEKDWICWWSLRKIERTQWSAPVPESVSSSFCQWWLEHCRVGVRVAGSSLAEELFVRPWDEVLDPETRDSAQLLVQVCGCLVLLCLVALRWRPVRLLAGLVLALLVLIGLTLGLIWSWHRIDWDSILEDLFAPPRFLVRIWRSLEFEGERLSRAWSLFEQIARWAYRKAWFLWSDKYDQRYWDTVDYIPCNERGTCLAVIKVLPWSIWLNRWFFYLLDIAWWISKSFTVALARSAAPIGMFLLRLWPIYLVVASGWMVVSNLLIAWILILCGQKPRLSAVRVPYPTKDASGLAGLYLNKESVVPDAKRADIHAYGFQDKAIMYTARGWDLSTVNWSGISLPGLMNLIQNGVGVSVEDRKNASQKHHGHMYMRKCSDYMRAQSENAMIRKIKACCNGDSKKILMINVGAKLGADSSRWEQMFGLDTCVPEIHQVHIRPADESCGNEENWTQTGFKPGVLPAKLVAKVDGNKTYSKSLTREYFAGTLQQWVAQSSTPNSKAWDLILVGMNDCHYYFAEGLPSHPVLDRAVIFTSGLNFSPFNGSYKLPDNNGSYRVFDGAKGEKRLWMDAYLNASGYTHEWVHYPTPLVILNSGWIQHFMGVCSWRDWRVETLRNEKAQSSIQDEFLQKQMKSVPGEEWKKLWYQNSADKDLHPVTQQTVNWTMESFDTASLGLGRVLARTIWVEDCRWMAWTQGLRGVVRSTSDRKSLVDTVLRSEKFESLATLGSIRVAGWNAENGSSWNPEFVSWKDYCAKLSQECRFKSTKPEPLKASLSWSRIEEYFEVKPVRVADLTGNRALKKPRKGTVEAFLLQCQRYVELMLPKANPRSVRKTRHGPELQGNEGVRISYEWCSKSPINMISALFNRQLKSKLEPHPETMAAFKAWFDPWFEEKFSKINWEPEIVGWESWLNASGWDDGKKQKYHESFARLSALREFNPRDWEYAFSAMVKSGEVYFRESTARDLNNCLLDRDDRPRLIFVPSKNACGPITWIQQLIFSDLKRVVPGFIQGYTTEELKLNILKHKPAESKCVSSDGSSFDSHQHKEIMEIVDDKIWSLWASRIGEVCNRFFPHPEVMKRGLLWQAGQHDARLFLQLPEWTLHCGDEFLANKEVRQFFPVSGSDWIEVGISGTTFSGQPVKTTLGNTLRSIAYHEYLCHVAGIADHEKYVIASGDDVCCWICSSKVDHYLEAVRTLTAINCDPRVHGLGQCIKEVKVSEWWDMDFCSKLCHFENDKWTISRDGSKLWTEKMDYIGKLEDFHREPERHVAAMLASVKCELNHPVTIEFMRHRLTKISQILQASNPSGENAALNARVARIQNWLSGNGDADMDVERQKWIASTRRKSWTEKALPTELLKRMLSRAGWDGFSFLGYYASDVAHLM